MNDNLAKTLFVDIETVARANSYAELDDEWKILWNKQCQQSYKDRMSEVPGAEPNPETLWKEKAAIHPEFGNIACIVVGYLSQNDGKTALRLKPLFGESESDLLTKFNSIVGKFDRLCAYNGKKFDFPYLSRRSLVNNVPIANLLNTMGKKPWENENIDPMELWQFGHFSFPSMDLLCKLLDIPLKSIMHGSEVHDVYYVEKDYQKIARYCAGDVIAVAKLLLKITGVNINIDEVVLA